MYSAEVTEAPSPMPGNMYLTGGEGKKRNRSHTQTHDKNSTTNDHTKNHPLT